MEKLTPLSKVLIAGILVGSALVAVNTYDSELAALRGTPNISAASPTPLASAAAAALPGAQKQTANASKRPLRVAVSQWPGHMPILIATGGMRTEPGSPAAKLGLDLEVVFIEDAASKNKALENDEVDFVWQTVDELPISLGGYRKAGVEPKAFLQIDWSRGGDACVSTKEVQKVEDIVGKKAATLLFSPDHTVFEFMISNSQLTPEQVAGVRKATTFSPDDFTLAGKLFAEGKVDVACMWEPDVTLALASKPGAHRLFSTADATELVADVLLAKSTLLETRPEVAEKLARAWFEAVAIAQQDKPKAARLISKVASRFRDELGYEKTLAALDWAKWTELADNARFFGLDGSTPGFDRVYNQADGIWVNYPEAEIKDRFAPVVVRDDRIVRRIWEAAGKPTPLAVAEVEPERARVGTPVFTKSLTINFATGSGRLSHESIAVINQQVLAQMQMAGSMSVRVEGNTDNVGNAEDNQKLSEQRARAIVEYLVSKGIAATRVVARGNGWKNPIASNSTAEGRARNRRTDILFIRGGQS